MATTTGRLGRTTVGATPREVQSRRGVMTCSPGVESRSRARIGPAIRTERDRRRKHAGDLRAALRGRSRRRPPPPPGVPRSGWQRRRDCVLDCVPTRCFTTLHPATRCLDHATRSTPNRPPRSAFLQRQPRLLASRCHTLLHSATGVAGVAQLVERQLPKLNVEGSSPFTRLLAVDVPRRRRRRFVGTPSTRRAPPASELDRGTPARLQRSRRRPSDSSPTARARGSSIAPATGVRGEERSGVSPVQDFSDPRSIALALALALIGAPDGAVTGGGLPNLEPRDCFGLLRLVAPPCVTGVEVEAATIPLTTRRRHVSIDRGPWTAHVRWSRDRRGTTCDEGRRTHVVTASSIHPSITLQGAPSCSER